MKVIDEAFYHRRNMFLFLNLLLFMRMTAIFFLGRFVLLFVLFLSLSFLLITFPVLAFFLPAGVNFVIDGNLLKIVVSQEEREAIITIALDAENILILLLGEGRVLRVDVFHDVCYLFRVQAAVMLKPNDPTVNPTIVTVRSQLEG